MLAAAAAVRAGVEAIPGLRVLGDPKVVVVVHRWWCSVSSFGIHWKIAKR